jgi:uncharacterized protein (DUF58 family)
MGPEDFRRFRGSKVKLFSRIKPRNIFPGEWESIFRGEGIEFAEIKPFEPGDDLRDLNLHALVQSGEEELIQRVVERQMRIYVWVDLSGSMHRFEEMFFPQKPEIRDIALGLLLFSACNTYSPVGLCAFSQGSTRFFPARIGERYCWEILDWIVEDEYCDRKTAGNVEAALSLLAERALPHSLAFLISDFEDRAFEGDFTAVLRPIVKDLDFVPVVIRDPLEKRVRLKRSVRVSIANSEGSKDADIYLTPQKLSEIQEASARHLAGVEENFRKLGIDHIVLDTPSVEDCYETLSGFFQARRRIRG